MKQALVNSKEMSKTIISLIIIVLTIAIGSIPYALIKYRGFTGPLPTNQEQIQGIEAAEQGWPSTTPHTTQWPSPQRITKWSKFGSNEYQAYWNHQTYTGVNGFSMNVQKLGWPLPVLEVKQMNWDWTNPALKGPEPDPRPQLVPLGLTLNPLILGLPIWLVFFVLPLLNRIYLRVLSQRRSECVWCGHRLDSIHLGSECGIANDSID